MSFDRTKIKPVPIQKTLALLNNFVANTTSFFNVFSETVEKRISAVSSKITDLETLLAVLEAKLNSVPDLESLEAVQPQVQAAEVQSSYAPTSEAKAAPSTIEQTIHTPAAASGDENMCPVSDHPDYSAFFKLLKVGVPPFVVQAKVAAAGLDPSMVDTPDRLVRK